MIGVCGDNCSFCPRYHATLSGDAKELEKVKELWVRLGLREPDFPTQDIACYGCKPENNCAFSEVRACAYGKGVENCGLCNAYPCEKLLAVFDKAEELQTHAVHLCTPEEMDALHKAFCCKRQNLDLVHFDHKDEFAAGETGDRNEMPTSALDADRG